MYGGVLRSFKSIQNASGHQNNLRKLKFLQFV